MEWISVKERLPEVGVSKPHSWAWLITDGKQINISTSHPDWWNKEDSWGMMDKVTHWMPLPDPPHQRSSNVKCDTVKQTIYEHGGSRIWTETDGRRNLIADTYQDAEYAKAVRDFTEKWYKEK